MPRNEEGEYELVLGTPQLLSVIFILIVLLGVVFSAGYFLGRTAGGEAALAPEEAGRRAASTAAPGARPADTGARATPATPPAEVTAPLEPGEAKVATGPAAGAGPKEATSARATTQTQAAAAPQPPAGPAAQGTSPAAEPPAIAEPEPGQTFLQVAAVGRNQAEFLADVLKRKGFPARVAPGPSETVFRVIVGPLRDEEEIARTRKRLEEAGVRSTYLRRY